MAQKTVVSFVDDLDGESEAEDTVPFALDGVEYEIDLTSENSEELREIFAPYIAAGRRTGGRARSGRGQSRSTSTSNDGGVVARGREALKAIRDWAKTEGWAVSDRGRLPNNVVEAYDAAHK
jgi:nucleoid-associated protein Lsr2